MQQTVDSLMKKYMVSDKSAGYGGRVTKYKHRFCNTEFGSFEVLEAGTRHPLRAVAARRADSGRIALAHQSPVRVRRRRAGRSDARESNGTRRRSVHRPAGARRRRPGIPLRAFVLRAIESVDEPAAGGDSAEGPAGGAGLSERVRRLEELVTQAERGRPGAQGSALLGRARGRGLLGDAVPFPAAICRRNRCPPPACRSRRHGDLPAISAWPP